MTAVIDGVKVIDLEIHGDVRGSFVEYFRQSWLPTDHTALQGNISRSTSGVLRGMHFHRRQWDYWFVVSGAAFVALADLRRGSPTERATMTMRLAADEPRGLFIPSGVAHGFFAESEFVLGYLIDRYFDGADEFGFAWDDPSLGIDWPTADPILSDRDRVNPSLAEALHDPVPYTAIVG
jgi:dTDP-4-dehydrorhamnose 3,5-epimerase